MPTELQLVCKNCRLPVADNTDHRKIQDKCCMVTADYPCRICGKPRRATMWHTSDPTDNTRHTFWDTDPNVMNKKSVLSGTYMSQSDPTTPVNSVCGAYVQTTECGRTCTMPQGHEGVCKNFSRLRELEELATMKDEDIDTSDIPEITDWSKAERGKYFDSFPALTAERQKSLARLKGACAFAHGYSINTEHGYANDNAIAWKQGYEYCQTYLGKEVTPLPKDFPIDGLTPHEILHRLWSKAVGTTNYNKSEWRHLEKIMQRTGTTGTYEQ